MIDAEVVSPFYPDLAGLPLQLGSIWYGSSGQNPVTSPVTVYWDSAGTQPAAQPITVINGHPTRNGAPARIYVNGDYSKLVQDSMGRQVTYEPMQAARTLDNLTFLQSGAGAVPRGAQDKMRESISITDFGAVAGDVGDQTAAIQLALNTARSVYIPEGTFRLAGPTSLKIPDDTRLFGPGKLHYAWTTNGYAIELQGDRIVLEGFTLYGDNSGSYVASNIGILGQRTTFSPLSVTWINVLTIRNMLVYGFGDTGITVQWVSDARITDNRISGCGFHGISLMSPRRSIVSRNQVNQIGPGTATIGYGISLTRYTSASLADAPAPSDCSIVNNTVTNVTVYCGIDCHSADNVVISGNVTRNCTVSLNLEHGSGGGDLVTCSNVSITGNSFNGPIGTKAPAIIVDAQSGAGEIAQNITISGNTITNHGVDPASIFFPTNGGAIFIDNATGVSVSGNSFLSCLGRCVSSYVLSSGITVVGNTVQGLIANSGGVQEAFAITGSSGQMTANGNTMVGSAGSMFASSAIDRGYGMKVGAENTHLGGCTIASAGALQNIRGGALISAPRVMGAWDSTGTRLWTAFEDINFADPDFTIVKNGTGDFSVTWPSGIFENGVILPLFVGKDPAAGTMRTQVVTNDGLTAARCKTFDNSGVAIDCAENVLAVSGR